MKQTIIVNIPVETKDGLIEETHRIREQQAATNCWECFKELEECCRENPINHPDTHTIMGFYCCECNKREKELFSYPE